MNPPPAPQPLSDQTNPVAAKPRTSRLAITSVVLGMLSFLTYGLTSIPAVICGCFARDKIKRSEGRQVGYGLAMARWILGGLGCVMGLLSILVGIPSKKDGIRAEAISNAKAIGMALFSFEQDYGMYPCDATAAEVMKKHPNSKLNLGKSSSNDYFRQLIAAGIIDSDNSEMAFYAHIKACRKPDKVTDGSHALEKGECGFSYLIGATARSKIAQPLLVTPLIPGTDRFDPKPLGGKAVIYWTDNSATTLAIAPDGHVMHLGANLLDPANPVWHGKAPRIVWPE